ncbi:MAG: DUF6259 domain-containing protein [Verrucomicrobiae bacterium]|nr:DUF6259 domain-containing protein [Verrucomicrobiae bacterium]
MSRISSKAKWFIAALLPLPCCIVPQVHATTEPVPRVQDDGKLITVENNIFRIVHDRAQRGGMPSEITWKTSGRSTRDIAVHDRLYNHERKIAYWLRHDANPVLTVRQEQNNVTVEIRARYLSDKGKAPDGQARAAYRFHYGVSEIVRVEARIEQQEPESWDELHFCEWLYSGQTPTHFFGSTDQKKQTCRGTSAVRGFPRWAAMGWENDILGLISGQVLCYDGFGVKSYRGCYLHGDWTRWSEMEYRTSAFLCIGSREQGASAIEKQVSDLDAKRSQPSAKLPLVSPPRLFIKENAQSMEFGNGLINFRFSRCTTPSGGAALRLDGIWDGTDGANCVAETPEVQPLWALGFVAQNGRDFICLNSQSASQLTWHAEQTGDVIHARFEWSGFPTEKTTWLRKVQTSIQLKTGHPASEWRLSMELDGKQALRSAEFPILPQLAAPPDSAFYYPSGWGREYRDPATTAQFFASYPSGYCNMQFVLLHRQTGGLYIGQHDPNGGQKLFSVKAGWPDSAATFRVRHVLSETPLASGPVMEYPCAIACYRGNWISGAKIYRQWALNQSAWATPPLSQNPATPSWFKELDIWCMDGCSDGQASLVVPRVKRFRESLGQPCALHWYCWHQNPFDQQYPDFFPAKEGFTEGIRALQNAGVRVIPYINGHSYDRRSASWKVEGPESCTRQLDGSENTETFGANTLAVMCPAAPPFQRRIQGVAERLLREQGVDGVYLDEIGNSPVVPCYNKKHGHPPGGGHWWTIALRQCLAGIREKLGPNGILCTEGAADVCGGMIDGFLMCNSTSDGLAPLYSAVYAGHHLCFGRYFTRNDLNHPSAFTTKAVQMFHFGAQLGWLDPTLEKTQKTFQFLQKLAFFRKQLHPFLVYGELIEPPVGCQGSENFSVTWKGYLPGVPDEPLTFPSVMRSTWRSEDGRVAILLTNLRDVPQPARLSLTVSDLLKKKPCSVTFLAPAGQEKPFPLNQSVWEFKKELSPLEMLAIIFE